MRIKENLNNSYRTVKSVYYECLEDEYFKRDYSVMEVGLELLEIAIRDYKKNRGKRQIEFYENYLKKQNAKIKLDKLYYQNNKKKKGKGDKNV